MIFFRNLIKGKRFIFLEEKYCFSRTQLFFPVLPCPGLVLSSTDSSFLILPVLPSFPVSASFLHVPFPLPPCSRPIRHFFPSCTRPPPAPPPPGPFRSYFSPLLFQSACFIRGTSLQCISFFVHVSVVISYMPKENY